MNQRPSRTFIVAGVIVGLSLFVLLAMLFYGPMDYSERSEQIAGEDGLRFHIASLFFGSFGIGAYVGWMIILTWAIIVFFRESVGELALRAVSLAVVVISGAALAELLGSGHLGGDLGYAIGSVLEASLGTALGVLLIGAVFGVSIVLATDYGFHSYYKEARDAIAVVEEEPVVAEEPSDLITRIDKAASEVEEEVDEEMPPVWPPAHQEAEDDPVQADSKPPIEEEEFDDILDVTKTGETESPQVESEATTEQDLLVPAEEMEEDAELLIEPEEEAVAEAEIAAPDVVEAEAEPEEQAIEEPAAPAVEVEAESVPEEETPTARLATALDALLGPAEEVAEEDAAPEIAAAEVEAEPETFIEVLEPEPTEENAELAVETTEPEVVPVHEQEMIEVPTVLIDDEIYVMDESLHEIAEEEPERREDPITEEMPAVAEEPLVEPELVEAEISDSIVASVVREREVIEDLIEEAEDDVIVEELVDVTETTEGTDAELLPFMEDEEEKTGVFRSFFRKKRSARRAAAASDPLIPEAASLVIDRAKASVVLLQRRLDIGHTRASRIIEALELEGLVGPLLESGSREVLMTRIEWETRG